MSLCTAPSIKYKGQHALHLALLNTIDLETVVDIVEDDGLGITISLIEQCHNDWSFAVDEPDMPWWKVLVKGQDVLFVYHHLLGDGRSGQSFHREPLDALYSNDGAGTAEDMPRQYLLRRSDMTWDVPQDPLRLYHGKLSPIELILDIIKWHILMWWYSGSCIYNDFPNPRRMIKNATAIAKSEERIVPQAVRHYIP